MDAKAKLNDIVKTVLSLLGKDSEVLIEIEEGRANVRINGQEDGSLIGFRGKNIQAIERVLTLMINRDLPDGEKIRVSVDVNDYKVTKDNQLKSMVKGVCESVKENGQSYEMRAMTPRERKLVHDVVNEFEDLKSESIGEDEERRVVISKR